MPNAPVSVGALEFDSEFNGTSLDPHWAPNWFGEGDSMNNVKNYAANVTEANGYVSLKLASSSSGALISTNPNGGAPNGGFTFTYGYAEARILFPGSGQTIYNWPAFWTDGQSWPTNGEIDIAEGLGVMTANYHDPAGAFNSPEPDTTQAVGGVWATYGVYWTPTEIEWFINGQLVHTLTSATTEITSSPQYLIINNGAGHTASIGASVEVDYVRAWGL